MGYLFSFICLVVFFFAKDQMLLLCAACFAIAGAIEVGNSKKKN